MSYKCEMHLHSNEVSLCGKSSYEKQIDKYKSLGYDGVFFTDHFWRGNTRLAELKWEEKIRAYESIYNKARAYGDKAGLDVFFGFELCFEHADFLIYGIDCGFLLSHPELENSPASETLTAFRENGGFVVHAHPFREAHYIDRIILYPRYTDGVEVLNTHNKTKRADVLAEEYARQYGFFTTCGSDFHADREQPLCGMVFDDKPSDVLNIIELIKDGKYSFSVI